MRFEWDFSNCKRCGFENLIEGWNGGLLMKIFQIVLFIFLIVCAISVTFSKNLLNSIIIFMSYSLIMSIIWILLESPDLAITEAAVGAGITSILFFVTLKKIHAIIALDEDKVDKHPHKSVSNKKGEAK